MVFSIILVPVFLRLGSHIADLNALRETIYTLRESKYYIFMILKNLPEEELEKINDDEIRNYDNHVEAFVKKMEYRIEFTVKDNGIEPLITVCNILELSNHYK